MISLTDPEGTITASNVYDETGDVKLQITPGQDGNLDRMYNFYFSGYRNVEENPFGHQTIYYYDDKGRTIAVENQLGYKMYIEYDNQNHVISKTDPKGYKTYSLYDAFNNLTNTIDALGNRTSYEYDETHHLITVTDPLGNVTRYEYDAEHHPVKTIDPLNNEVTTTYYEDGLPKTMTDTRGNITVYTYDTYGNPETITYPNNGIEKYIYNSRGDLIQSTDPNNNISYITYDKRRLQTTVTDAKGNISSTEYNSFGKPVSVTDARGFTSCTSYTPSYKAHTVTAPDGAVVSNVYDADDNVIAVVDPRGNISRTYYDAAKRVIAVDDPLGNRVTNCYDANNNIVSATDPLGNTVSNVYDALNRVIHTIDPRGYSTYSEYDEAGRVTKTIDALNNATRIEYDALGRKTAIVRPDTLTEQFEYDAAGNMIRFINANQQEMSFGYDEMNRVTAVTNALGYTERYTYDKAGNKISRTDAESRMTLYEYDELNNVVKIQYADNSTVTFRYDENGNMTLMTDPAGPTRHTYDELNRLTDAIDHNGNTVHYSYDLSGNRTNVSFNGYNMPAVSVAYEYDPANRITAVHFPDNYVKPDNVKHKTAFEYDSAGQLTHINYPNGVTADYTYNEAGQLSDYAYKKGYKNFLRRTIVRNKLGFKKEEEIIAGLEPMPVMQNTQVRTYDPADQITNIQYEIKSPVDNEHRDVCISYSHDKNGNLNSALPHTNNIPVPHSETMYTYDNENRLIRYLPLSNESAAEYIYTYDGLGNRTRRTKNGETRNHILDRGAELKNVLAETSPHGEIVRVYIWGPNGLLAQIDVGSEGGIYFFHANELGSTLAVTDENGEVTDEICYTPYGEICNRRSGFDTPYLYIGGHGIYYEGLNLYHIKARYYDSSLKRFISKDPIGLEGGYNLYVYANANPLVYIDGLGWCAENPDSTALDYFLSNGYDSLFNADNIDWDYWKEPWSYNYGSSGIRHEKYSYWNEYGKAVFEGSQIAAGTGAGAKFKLGPIKVNAEMKNVAFTRITRDGLDEGVEEAAEIGIELGPLWAKYDFKHGFDKGTKLKHEWATLKNFTTIEIGGTFMDPHTFQCAEGLLKIHLFIDHIPKERSIMYIYSEDYKKYKKRRSMP